MQTMEKGSKVDRREFIGGSDIAVVMGVSRWKSPLQLWAEKTGKIELGETSEAAELGTELEDFVARQFMKRTELKVRRTPKIYIHEDFDFLRCQVDRLVEGTDELLECKTCSAWKAKEWEGEDIPAEYVLQVNWQMGITGRFVGHIAVLIGGQSFRYKKINFDQGLFEKQVNAALEFWNGYVLTDTPPMAVAGDTETLISLFPDAKGDLLEIEDKEKLDLLNTALERRNELLGEKDAVAKELDGIDVKLKQVVGEAPGILTDRFKITWTPQVSRRADPEKMKEAGIFEKFSKETKTRVLRVSSKNGQKNGQKKGE